MEAWIAGVVARSYAAEGRTPPSSFTVRLRSDGSVWPDTGFARVDRRIARALNGRVKSEVEVHIPQPCPARVEYLVLDTFTLWSAWGWIPPLDHGHDSALVKQIQRLIHSRWMNAVCGVEPELDPAGWYDLLISQCAPSSGAFLPCKRWELRHGYKNEPCDDIASKGGHDV